MKKKLTVAIVIVLSILWLAPLYFVVINAFKTGTGVRMDPAGFTSFSFDQLMINLQTMLTNDKLRYVSSFITSVVITSISLLTITIVSSMAAWVLVRTKNKVSNFVFYTMVAAMIVPFQVVMLPLVTWFSTVSEFLPEALSLNQSIIGMVLAYTGFGAAFTIFMYHGFLKSVPVELEEAANIDGCSKARTFFMIVLPIMKPVTISLLILNGLWIWNDFLLPLVLLGNGNQIQTLPLAVSNFMSTFYTQWELIMTSLLITIAPALICYLVAQKHIIKGMMSGSIK